MAEVYLTLADIAGRVGFTAGAIRQLHKRSMANRDAGTPSRVDMPAEDIRLGVTPGWAEATIAPWIASRITLPPPTS